MRNIIRARPEQIWIRGTSLDDVIIGNSLDNVIHTYAPNTKGDTMSDLIFAGAGNDRMYDDGGLYNELYGQAGNDTFFSMKKDDVVMSGGTGKDTFVFATNKSGLVEVDGGAGYDTIRLDVLKGGVTAKDFDLTDMGDGTVVLSCDKLPDFFIDVHSIEHFVYL
jgi:Ca2+-binding RTX toxin-like protein